jgi:hypothetical protein
MVLKKTCRSNIIFVVVSLAIFSFAILLGATASAFEITVVGDYVSSGLTTKDSGDSFSYISGSKTIVMTETAMTSASKIGGGLLFSQMLDDDFALELGLLYLPMEATTTFGATANSSGDGTFTEKWDQTYLQIPLILKYYVFTWMSAGLGAYYSLPMGNLTESGTNNTGVSLSSVNGTYGSTPDYGLMATVGLRIPIDDLLWIFLDWRYQYGLANITLPTSEPVNLTGGATALPGDTNHWQNTQILAGITYGF